MDNFEIEKVIPTIPWMNIKTHIAHLAKGALGGKLHTHREIELLYVIEGFLEWRFPDATHVACKNDLVFVSDLYPHSTHALANTKYILVQFPKDKLFSSDLDVNNNLYKFMRKPTKPYHFYKANQESSKDIVKHMLTIYENFDKDKNHNKMYICAACLNIMAELIKDGVEDSKELEELQMPQVKKILPITDYIEKNYHKPLYLNDLSLELGFNSVYLCRIFKKATGKTITDYINFIRIQNCIKLLKNEDISITEAALNCGFSNIPHFNSTFKKHMGCSPGVYRKSQM